MSEEITAKEVRDEYGKLKLVIAKSLREFTNATGFEVVSIEINPVYSHEGIVDYFISADIKMEHLD